LLAADEVFLTNAIQIMRWAQWYKGRQYGCAQTRKIFEAVSATIFDGLC
jgi:branched-chain amino acid aminotransferase